MSKIKLRKFGYQKHLWLSWLAGTALLCFIVSGLTHPLVVWTGPQSTAFMPPRATMQSSDVNNIKEVLIRHQINQAIVVKLVPSAKGVVLQITEHSDKARRYFDLQTFDELVGFDEQHAIWLARYYTLGGDDSIAVKSVTFQTEFDDAYPWVNRLLPVYKIEFDDLDELSSYVYTEINALGSISNNYKTRLQTFFRVIHTWSWLNRFDNARVLIMVLLLLSIIAMTVTGMCLVLLLKQRKKMTRKARLHRQLAYVLWLPILAFSISGFWHLLHSAYNDREAGLQLGDTISLSPLFTAAPMSELPSTPLNQLSLIEHANQLMFRLSIARTQRVEEKVDESDHQGGEHAHHNTQTQREGRFNGNVVERGSLYYRVADGTLADITDEDVSKAIASKQLGVSESAISASQLITSFNSDYDFRNKRIPVWQINVSTEQGDRVFIDPATGILVDRVVNLDKYESFSFSHLHKWSFLTQYTGRFWRDMLMVFCLSLVLLLSVLGLLLKLKRH